ncbi:SET domain-containing 4 [Micractinium conductrix]|uniref:SET domain-containing 4 n=1 Tax=Micractinium conductrix TaxID=554055 RepID=A0A2P6VKA2_9CHLO|nr:SET domain-containing 4 [Micractinium conductrix]|eukprot:PSC74531.1 SET domain-containing 4 [Micractinium conductrix]
MGVLLLRERSKARGSPVWGYIEQLPDSIDTPVRWEAAELEQLQYQPAIDEIRQQQASWRQQYDKFAAALQPGAGPCSWEDFLWAVENVRSRAFSGPYTGSSVGEKARTLGLLLAAGGGYTLWAHLPLEQALNGLISVLVFNIMYDLLISQKLKWYALCPVVDAINHNSLVESDVQFEYFQDQFVLSTKSAYAKGQQVFISYGSQANGSLLQYYGFTGTGWR